MTEKSANGTTHPTVKAPPASNKSFPNPFDLPTPAGAEGWEELYPYYYLLSPERQEMEEGKL